jgi:hypothetical protein
VNDNAPFAAFIAETLISSASEAHKLRMTTYQPQRVQITSH